MISMFSFWADNIIEIFLNGVTLGQTVLFTADFCLCIDFLPSR